MTTATKKRMPKRLKKEPLLEAVWELRFEGDPAAGGVLPGILFEQYRASGREPKIETLPPALIPPATRNAQDAFRFAPTSLLRFGNYAVLTGDRIAALSVTRPYPGWAEYERRISELAGWLRDSKMVKTPEQCTLKYLDFFECGLEEVFKRLRVQIRIGKWQAEPGELRLQMKVQARRFDGIIQIMNPARVTVEGQAKEGLVTDVQVTWKKKSDGDFWKGFPEMLARAKTACHELFFGLLNEETLQAHGPIYED